MSFKLDLKIVRDILTTRRFCLSQARHQCKTKHTYGSLGHQFSFLISSKRRDVQGMTQNLYDTYIHANDF